MGAEGEIASTTREIALRQLRALLEAQTRLRKAAEEQARESRHELERLAETVCPEEVDRLRRRSPEGLSALTPHQVAQMVLTALAPRLGTALSEQPIVGQAEAEARLRQLEIRLQNAEERAARAEAEVDLLRRGLHEVETLAGAAAALLEAAGYKVERLPDPLLTPSGETFQPDLAIWLEGRRLPVGAEDLHRSLSEREARWEACHAIGEGHLLFVAPDPRMLDVLRSEVFFWVGSRPLRLWMTDLERGWGLQGEAVWLVRREQR